MKSLSKYGIDAVLGGNKLTCLVWLGINTLADAIQKLVVRPAVVSVKYKCISCFVLLVTSMVIWFIVLCRLTETSFTDIANGEGVRNMIDNNSVKKPPDNANTMGLRHLGIAK